MRNGPRDRRAGPPVPWIDPPVQFRIPHSTLRILYPRPRSSFKESRQHPPRPHLPQLLRRRPRDAAGRAGQVARGGIPQDPYHLPHAVARVAEQVGRARRARQVDHALQVRRPARGELARQVLARDPERLSEVRGLRRDADAAQHLIPRGQLQAVGEAQQLGGVGQRRAPRHLRGPRRDPLARDRVIYSLHQDAGEPRRVARRQQGAVVGRNADSTYIGMRGKRAGSARAVVGTAGAFTSITTASTRRWYRRRSSAWRLRHRHTEPASRGYPDFTARRASRRGWYARTTAVTPRRRSRARAPAPSRPLAPGPRGRCRTRSCASPAPADTRRSP